MINATDSTVVTLTSTDALSGVDYLQYKIMDSSSQDIAGHGFKTITGNTDTVDLSGLGDGDYILRARAFDKIGNKKSGVDVAFTIDRTAPGVTLTAPASNDALKGIVDISGTVTDNQTLKNYYLTVFNLDTDTVAYTKNYPQTTNISGLLASWEVGS